MDWFPVNVKYALVNKHGLVVTFCCSDFGDPQFINDDPKYLLLISVGIY